MGDPVAICPRQHFETTIFKLEILVSSLSASLSPSPTLNFALPGAQHEDPRDRRDSAELSVSSQSDEGNGHITSDHIAGMVL